MKGFQKAQQEWEHDNIYFPLDKFDCDATNPYEYEDPEVDRRLEDRDS